MQLNKKGMTLIELLITIVFVGMILVFMFSLLNDLKGETDNNSFVFANQVNKTDAIHTIQKDLNTYDLLDIKSLSNNSIKLEFTFSKGDAEPKATLSVTKKDGVYYLNYVNASSEKYSWEMKDAIIDECASFIIHKDSDELPSYYFNLKLLVYNKNYHELNNKTNNNIIDDIEISYYGLNNLKNNNGILTDGTHQIGKCTN